MNRPPMITSLRVLAALAAALAFAVAQTGTADAHVRVKADNPTAGSFSALTFRVPNESDTASTSKVSVELPQDTPFLSVSTKPVPGWTAEAREETLAQPVEVDGTTITKAIRTVTWTASADAEIGPGEYQEFSISVGPLPAAGTILLPATQTYTDKKIVRWDQPTPASGAEPDLPAPTLVVAAADDPQADPQASASPGAATAAPVAATTDNGARGLAAIGLLVGVAGLVVAGAALRQRSRS